MCYSECIFCDFENFGKINTSKDIYVVNCPICGKYEITLEAAEKAKEKNVDIYLLQGYTRYYSLRNKSGLFISTQNLDNILNSPIVPKSITQKLNILLQNLDIKTSYGGELLTINFVNDFPLGFSQNEDELKYLLLELERRNYIEIRSKSEQNFTIQILSDGWGKIEKLNETNRDSKQCFVAMSFDKNLDELYDKAISKAIIDSGFYPFRLDREEHTDLIPFKMIAELKKSKFIVADFTQHKNGVYFEAGFGIGANIPVIWLCNKADFENAHFDIKQFNHILYENTDDLYLKLKTRIEAIII